MKWRRCTNCRNARAKANWRVRPLGIHPASAAFHKICTRRLCPPENRRLVRGSNRSTKVTVGPTCTTDSICHRKEGLRYPVIVEYAGNKWRTSPGTVEGSNPRIRDLGGNWGYLGLHALCRRREQPQCGQLVGGMSGQPSPTARLPSNRRVTNSAATRNRCSSRASRAARSARGQSGTIGDAVPDDLSLRVHARRGPSRDFCLEFC